MSYLSETQKKTIRLIAFDLDGTLLDASSHVTERTRRALEQARERGYVLCAATGRVYTSIPKDIKEISAITHVISSNGAYIVHQESGKNLYENLLDGKALEAVKPILRAPEVMPEVFFQHRGYIGKEHMDHFEDFARITEKRLNYVRTTRTQVDDIYALIEEHQNELENIKLNIKDPDRTEHYLNLLRTYPGITVVGARDFGIEIGGPTTSKANALEQLCRMFDAAPENLMVFGDGDNDLAMLRYAGVSVAMGNAEPHLLETADVICPANTEDGLAIVLEELLA